MILEKSIESYGIYMLIFVYIFINFYYKNILNIVIFFIALLSTINLLDIKIYSLIIAYVISILYGIYNNYHLLENFKLDIKEIKEQESKLELEIKDLHSEFTKFMSDRLCYNYTKHIQSKSSKLIIDTKENCNSLKPILKELDSKLVSKLIKDGPSDRRIVISNDRFIILGHYWWYVYKVLINQNKMDEDIDVIIIDMPLKKIAYSIKDFKDKSSVV
jgi:hypothetical protein